jgi:hypothetical protein
MIFVSSPVESISPRRLSDSSAHHPKLGCTSELKTFTLKRRSYRYGGHSKRLADRLLAWFEAPSGLELLRIGSEHHPGFKNIDAILVDYNRVPGMSSRH